VRAGKLRHRITLQDRDTTRDSHGGYVKTWTDVATGIPAEAEPLRGREYAALQAAQSDVSIRFRIRYRSDVTATMRVLWEGKAFEIVGPPIDVAGLHRELWLMCQGDPDA
jgi:SPP1 family predicted phage head-tail adaptor